MIIGLGLLVAVEVTVEMPFPAVHRFVASGAEELGRGDFGRAKVGHVSNRKPTPDAITIGSAAGQNGGTGGRANSTRRVSLREANPFGRELIEVRCLDARVAVTSEIPPPQVIGEEDDDVGFGFSKGQAGENEKEEKSADHLFAFQPD